MCLGTPPADPRLVALVRVRDAAIDPPKNIHDKSDGSQDYTVTLYFNNMEQLNKAHICAVQHNLVTEVYSPPRVVQFADKHGLKPGHSIDIKCCDEQGRPWDLNEHKQRNKLIQLIVQT